MNTDRHDDVTGDVTAFERDEAIVTAYEDAKRRSIRSIMDAEELQLRHAYAQRREALNEEVASLRGVAEERRVRAAAAVQTYAVALPHRVRKAGIDRPSLWERIRSFDAAGVSYRAAATATDALDEVNALMRERRDKLDSLERETRRSVDLREEALRKKLRTPEGLTALHADAMVAQAYAKAQRVFAARAAYDERVQRGDVPPEEARDRAIVRHGYAFARPPLIGTMIARIERFGPLEYYLLRDLGNREYLLAADARLEPLRDIVFDVTHGAAGYDAIVRCSAGGVPMRVLDHLNATLPAADAADAYARHRAALRTDPPTRGAAPRDTAETELIAMLVLLANAVTASLSPT